MFLYVSLMKTLTNTEEGFMNYDHVFAALTRQNGNVENTETADDPLSISVMVSLGLKNPQEVWSLVENSRIFLGALKFFFSEREQAGNVSFDKDDQLAVEFVTAVADILASSFGIP
ncbi:hypothetical protein POM88_035624 [Heracleum sosnowskyi]|uniref:Uncharacterized protein n=1 Tax=Heracleum sosnowskyi TaxID=360622 RepID=A0AAD8HLN0_9APIA|nr:hypothetical protein POM88_035624 [Heracleum sosnowskyi]